MKRRWFQDDDGNYYRNLPLISGEKEALLAKFPFWPWQQKKQMAELDALSAEWKRCWSLGVLRTDTLGPDDEVVVPLSFREGYPNDPRVWVLDD